MCIRDRRNSDPIPNRLRLSVLAGAGFRRFDLSTFSLKWVPMVFRNANALGSGRLGGVRVLDFANGRRSMAFLWRIRPRKPRLDIHRAMQDANDGKAALIFLKED